MADIRVTPERDDFARANENPILPPWVRDWGGRIDNALSSQTIGSPSPNPGNASSSYWQTMSFTGDEIEIWSYPSGNANLHESYQMGLWTAGTPSGYELHSPNPVGSDSWQLWKYNSGSTTMLASVTRPVIYISTIVLLRTTATHLEAYESTDNGANWSLVVSVADTTYRTNLYLVLGTRGTGPGWGAVGGGVRSDYKTQIYRYVTR